jgi:pimeloyl-ACP methyl ester carboxylesterase
MTGVAKEVGELEMTKLPAGVRARLVPGVNGLTMHILEAGFETPGRPRVLLLHGFPELAYSWRKIMVPLAEAGFHVIAPDQRGYGRTTDWDRHYDGDLASYRLLNLVRDALALLCALGHRSVEAVVGHDFGSPVAAYCALARPDVFRSVALMSAPFEGPPEFPVAPDEAPVAAAADMAETLAALTPPRKHYQHYYGTRSADDNMRHCPQGIAAFLRAYYHHKSADWVGNKPFPLASWSAAELAKMPEYYIMDAGLGMAETVAREMPSKAQIANCQWLTNLELQVYAEEFSRTGFQGGLQWYRCATSAVHTEELRLFSRRRIEVPACFVAGAQDWGVYQRPGALEAMCERVCTRMQACDLIEGAGHWVQQERPDEAVRLLERFLSSRL